MLNDKGICSRHTATKTRAITVNRHEIAHAYKHTHTHGEWVSNSTITTTTNTPTHIYLHNCNVVKQAIIFHHVNESINTISPCTEHHFHGESICTDIVSEELWMEIHYNRLFSMVSIVLCAQHAKCWVCELAFEFCTRQKVNQAEFAECVTNKKEGKKIEIRTRIKRRRDKSEEWRRQNERPEIHEKGQRVIITDSVLYSMCWLTEHSVSIDTIRFPIEICFRLNI